MTNAGAFARYRAALCDDSCDGGPPTARYSCAASLGSAGDRAGCAESRRLMAKSTEYTANG